MFDFFKENYEIVLSLGIPTLVTTLFFGLKTTNNILRSNEKTTIKEYAKQFENLKISFEESLMKKLENINIGVVYSLRKEFKLQYEIELAKFKNLVDYEVEETKKTMMLNIIKKIEAKLNE